MSAPTSASSQSPRSASDDAGLIGNFDGERDILRAWVRGLTPDAHLTVSEWADRHRWLSSRASAEPGRYPNLSAALADIAHPTWRGSAIGVYRFWRDLGYGVGALILGAAAAVTGTLSAGFWTTALAIALSGLLLVVWGEETHPRRNPAE